MICSGQNLTMWCSRFILAVLVLMVLGGCFSQRGMLYQPGHYSFAEVREQAQRAGLRLWPTPDRAYQGVLGQPGSGPVRGTVVVFHGNAGPAAFRAHYAVALGRLGYRVLLAEYPGYGGRPGAMSEASFAADAAAVLRRAQREFGARVYVWGESLGAAVAAAAIAGEAPTPAGVVMFTPWDTLLHAARTHFPFLPVRLFLRDEYDNIANLSKFSGPVAVVLAERDQVVPSELGQRLYAELSGEKRLWTMPGVGHNDWRTDPGNPMWAEVMNYLRAQH